MARKFSRWELMQVGNTRGEPMFAQDHETNARALAEEMRALSTNTAIVQTQADRHITNWLARWAENEIEAKITTPAIVTHNA